MFDFPSLELFSKTCCCPTVKAMESYDYLRQAWTVTDQNTLPEKRLLYINDFVPSYMEQRLAPPNQATMMRTNVKLESRSSRPHMDEPVMIAGQAPVEPKPRLLQVKGIKKTACRRRKWVETLGIGKEMMHIMAIVRSLRLDFRCFGAVPTPLSSSSSSSSSSDEEEYADHEDVVDDDSKNSAPAIENNGDGESEKMNESEDQESHVPSLSQDTQVIKRCASAPAKGWQTRGHDQEKEEEEERKEGEDRALGDHKLLQGNQEQSERLILMSYAPDFFRVSPDITSKTWNEKSARLLHRSHSLMR